MKRYVFPVIVLTVAVVAAAVWLPGQGGDSAPTLPEVVGSDDFDPTPVPPEARRSPTRPAAEPEPPSSTGPEGAAHEARVPSRGAEPVRTPTPNAPTPSPTRTASPAQPTPEPTDPETQLARIREAMRGAMPRFRACYVDLLREYPDVTDRLLLRLEVAQDEETGRGVPSLVGIDSSDLAADELDCFADVLSGLPFPPPIPDEDGNLEPYTITYPVVLTAEQ